MYMVMLVLDDPNRLDEVLVVWNAIGVQGVTIAETTGAYRRLRSQAHVPARYALGGLAAGDGESNCTLWTIVPDEDTARRCLSAAEGVVGDLDGPDTGVLAAWPLAFSKGVPPRAASGVRGEEQ